eukprot:scaffold33790_cov60-Phaeocystis_antarctica.AAC.5
MHHNVAGVSTRWVAGAWRVRGSVHGAAQCNWQDATMVWRRYAWHDMCMCVCAPLVDAALVEDVRARQQAAAVLHDLRTTTDLHGNGLHDLPADLPANLLADLPADLPADLRAEVAVELVEADRADFVIVRIIPRAHGGAASDGVSEAQSREILIEPGDGPSFHEAARRARGIVKLTKQIEHQAYRFHL